MYNLLGPIFILDFVVCVSAELRKPRYVRVNTLKVDTEFALRELRQQYPVCSLI